MPSPLVMYAIKKEKMKDIKYDAVVTWWPQSQRVCDKLSFEATIHLHYEDWAATNDPIHHFLSSLIIPLQPNAL